MKRKTDLKGLFNVQGTQPRRPQMRPTLTTTKKKCGGVEAGGGGGGGGGEGSLKQTSRACSASKGIQPRRLQMRPTLTSTGNSGMPRHSSMMHATLFLPKPGNKDRVGTVWSQLCLLLHMLLSQLCTKYCSIMHATFLDQNLATNTELAQFNHRYDCFCTQACHSFV